MKICNRCHTEKPLTDFYKQAAASDGHQYACKECQNKHASKWFQANKDDPSYKARHYKNEQTRRAKDPYLRVAENHRKFARDIDMDYEELENWYTAQFLRQQAHCAVCGKITEQLCIDHNHETNELRGLLCRDCNYGLGCFKDNPDFLYEAGDYLVASTTVKCV